MQLWCLGSPVPYLITERFRFLHIGFLLSVLCSSLCTCPGLVTPASKRLLILQWWRTYQCYPEGKLLMRFPHKYWVEAPSLCTHLVEIPKQRETQLRQRGLNLVQEGSIPSLSTSLSTAKDAAGGRAAHWLQALCSTDRALQRYSASSESGIAVTRTTGFTLKAEWCRQ